ncbi:MAG: 8-hydroxy-5-deazaflavin:NADPH oxidoreductase [Acidobacteriota bacterium]|jgi:predicted dinucleotide-binding enzyme|nr:8-hydroxy-5-deazaflavin:NADPH oxidoreductase [Acidobacteriota bacterium]
MRIGIIGAGNVGGSLGRGWARAGHEVTFGVRDPKDPKVQKLVAKTGAKAASVAEAAAFGEVVAFATPWEATEDAVRHAGDLAGKVVFDCTNPLAPQLAGLTHGFDTSAAEMVAAWAPGAWVVKVFNTTGANNMANPDYGGIAATMFYCGDDAEAKAAAARLAADLGFDPVDAGNLEQARLLEPLALLWIRLAYVQKQGREIAFKLLRR